MDSKHSAARLKGEKRREEKRREEKRREEDLETSLASESVLKWPLTWRRFRCCRRNAACGANIYHKTMQMCPLPTPKKTQKVSVSKIESKRERERESVSARLSRGTSKRTYIPSWIVHTSWLPGFTQFKSSTQTYSDQPKNQGFLQIFIVLATVHVRLCTMTSVLHGFQRKSQGFLQIFVVLASLHVWLCAIVSRAAHKNFCLTKTCQMKRQAMHFEVAECFHAGGSLSSDGAGTTQADSGFIKGFGFVPLHIYWNCFKAGRRSEESRGEEKKREWKGGNIGPETSLTSGRVLKWQKLTESRNRYAHSLHRVSMSKPKREREREIDNLYWQDSAEERLYINMQIWLQPGLFQTGTGSYCQFPEAGFLLKTLGGHPCSHGCLEGDLRRWIIRWIGGGWDCVLRWGCVSNPSPISIVCSPGHRSFPKTRRPISIVKIYLCSLQVSWLKGLSQH